MNREFLVLQILALRGSLREFGYRNGAFGCFLRRNVRRNSISKMSMPRSECLIQKGTVFG